MKHNKETWLFANDRENIVSTGETFEEAFAAIPTGQLVKNDEPNPEILHVYEIHYVKTIKLKLGHVEYPRLTEATHIKPKATRKRQEKQPNPVNVSTVSPDLTMDVLLDTPKILDPNEKPVETVTQPTITLAPQPEPAVTPIETKAEEVEDDSFANLDDLDFNNEVVQETFKDPPPSPIAHLAPSTQPVAEEETEGVVEESEEETAYKAHKSENIVSPDEIFDIDVED